MFNNFTKEAQRIMVDAKSEMNELKHPYVGTEHLLLGILKYNNVISSRLKKSGITYNKFKNELVKIVGTGKKESDWFLYTPLLKRVIENSIIEAREDKIDVDEEILFTSILVEGEGVGIRILMSLDVDIEALKDDFLYRLPVYEEKSIEKIGHDMSKLNVDPVVGREKELKRIMEILIRRTKNNPILVGEAGVGKTALIEELSRRISEGEVPDKLRGKKIISINIATTVSGTKYRGEFEEKIQKIIKEAEENPNIILFIDEIHTIVGAGGAEGAIDASNIFKPALSRGKLKCIGATTLAEYEKFIEPDAALARRFQKVTVEEPDSKTLFEILKKLKPVYEEFHNVKIKEELLNLIINLSSKYIFDRKEPDRSIDILDEVCARVSLKEGKSKIRYNELDREKNAIEVKKREAIFTNRYNEALKLKEKELEIKDEMNNIELNSKNKSKTVTKKDIALLLNERLNVPVYELLNSSDKVIRNIKSKLDKKIYGQKSAKEGIVELVKKIKLGYKKDRCYSVMFLGNKGTGKSYISSIFGEVLDCNLITLDMNLYKDPSSISKIVGSEYNKYENNNSLLSQVKNHPHSVIIVDEVEKANKNIINLFNNILESGYLSDIKGKKINFKEVFIIFNSNVEIKNKVGFKDEKYDISSYFDYSFISKIDKTIKLDDYNSEDIKRIIDLNIKKIQKIYDTKVSKEKKDKILELSDYKNFGALKIKGLIEEEIENELIDRKINKTTI